MLRSLFISYLLGLQKKRLSQFWRKVLVAKDTGKILQKHIPATGITEAAALAGLKVARDAGRNEPDLIAAISPYAKVIPQTPN